MSLGQFPKKQEQTKEDILRCYALWLESLIMTISKRCYSEEGVGRVECLLQGRCSGVVAEAMNRLV